MLLYIPGTSVFMGPLLAFNSSKHVLTWNQWVTDTGLLSGFLYQTCVTEQIIFSFIVRSSFCKHALQAAHKFSMCLISGEFPGHPKHIMKLFLKKFCTIFLWLARCKVLLKKSCPIRNLLLHPRNKFLLWHNFAQIVCTVGNCVPYTCYDCEFIIC